MQSRVAGTANALDALKGWREVNGVAAAARDPAITSWSMSDPDDVVRQREALKDYLTVKPLSPTRWLALADADLASGEPVEAAARAYEMSVLTGPYEGYVMGRRALMGLLLWEKLGPDQRIGAARDLAVGDFASTSQLMAAKGILGAKSKETRESVRFEMLQIEGLQADRLGNLGLQ
jgi:hypothetical protein